MIPETQAESLAWCAANYKPEQLQPHAEACARGECKSYIHCFLSKGGMPPVCACRILEEQKRQNNWLMAIIGS